MAQRAYRQGPGDPNLTNALRSLSAREQISLLVQATRPLSGRERAEVWRVAGFSVLRDRFLPILLHILLKRVLAGALWWFLCSVAALGVLFVLAWVEQINDNAVGPVLFAIIGFFIGFALFALVDFLRSIYQFFRTTCPKSTREYLLTSVNAAEQAQKIAILRTVSSSLASKIPGESLLDSLLSILVMLVTSALLVGLMILLTGMIPALGNFPWLLVVAGVAFFLGLFGPGLVQHKLLMRKPKAALSQ